MLKKARQTKSSEQCNVNDHRMAYVEESKTDKKLRELLWLKSVSLVIKKGRLTWQFWHDECNDNADLGQVMYDNGQ